MKRDSEGKGFVAFLVALLMPFILIFGGGGLVTWGVTMGSLPVIIFGAVIVLAGLVWGAFLLLLDGPLDMF
jgi:hypothetical protein